MEFPKTWEDVYYLTRKEINKDVNLPNYTIEQVETLHILFWRQVRTMLQDLTNEITILGIVRFYPKKHKIKQREEYLKNLNNEKE